MFDDFEYQIALLEAELNETFDEFQRYKRRSVVFHILFFAVGVLVTILFYSLLTLKGGFLCA